MMSIGALMNKNSLPHHMPASEVLEKYQSTEEGLTSEKVKEHQKQYGTNNIHIERSYSPIKRFFAQFHNILIYILIVASMITAFIGHGIDTIVIIIAIIANIFIGFIQEIKAENALNEIRKLLSLKAKVIRNKVTEEIDATHLVPGDIVIMEAGDKVPADIRLLQADSLRTQESILTGESTDVQKSTKPTEENSALHERSCILYSGTLITGGQGKGVVFGIGKDTEIGRISSLLSKVKTPQTPLTKKINRFSRWLAAIICAVILIVFLFGTYVRNLPLDEMLMIGISIAVSAIPEGLPAVISVILALGVRAMAKRNAIVRNLPAVESLGSVNIICTDKTGTLTRNELTLSHIVTANHTVHISGIGYIPDGKLFMNEKEISLDDYPVVKKVIVSGVLNNTASIELKDKNWGINGDPTEGALLVAGLKVNQKQESLLKEFPQKDIIPFSSETGYMATLHFSEEEKTTIIFIKGAPERLFSLCNKQLEEKGEIKDFNQKYWEEALNTRAKNGERVLGLIFKNTDANKSKLTPQEIASDFVFFGLVGIIDQARKEAKPAIEECAHAGVSVKMITGDHPLTAASIAKQLGITNNNEVLTGKEFINLTDEEVVTRVDKINVYARMEPEHKLRLVNALQAKKNIVAMTGDGVNDAPALKTANIGIAMGKQGTEVSKEASKLILADDNFATIVHAIEEGRNIFENIKRAIQFLLITDLVEGFVVIIAVFFSLTLPITPVQILWVNMVTSVTLSVPFAFIPRTNVVMNRPPLSPKSPMYTVNNIVIMCIQIAFIVGSTIALFYYEIRNGSNIAVARSVAINLLVSFQAFYLLALFPLRSNSESSWIKHWFPAIIAICSVIVFQAIFTYVPWMQHIFSVAPLSVNHWGKIFLISIILLILMRIKDFGKLLTKKAA